MSHVADVILFLSLPVVFALVCGDMLTQRECWTPLRGVGAWRNEQAFRRTLRLMESVRIQPATACAALVHSLGLYDAARRISERE